MQETIHTINELRDALVEAGKGNTANNTDFSLFARIAKSLLNNFCIIKNDITYRFIEIELYHNDFDPVHETNKKTYPRETDAGLWFFHSSGVDLTFKSDKLKYGGVLVRTIASDDGKEFVCGPQKVVDKLFSEFNAFESLQKMPYIGLLSNPSNEQPIRMRRFKFDSKPLNFCMPRTYWKNPGASLYPWYIDSNQLKDARKLDL